MTAGPDGGGSRPPPLPTFLEDGTVNPHWKAFARLYIYELICTMGERKDSYTHFADILRPDGKRLFSAAAMRKVVETLGVDEKPSKSAVQLRKQFVRRLMHSDEGATAMDKWILKENSELWKMIHLQMNAGKKTSQAEFFRRFMPDVRTNDARVEKEEREEEEEEEKWVKEKEERKQRWEEEEDADDGYSEEEREIRREKREEEKSEWMAIEEERESEKAARPRAHKHNVNNLPVDWFDDLLDRVSDSIAPALVVNEMKRKESFGPGSPACLPGIDQADCLKKTTIGDGTNKDDIERHWACSVLRFLAFMELEGDGWFFDFVESCSRDPYNRAALWFLYPRWKETLKERRLERERNERSSRIGEEAYKLIDTTVKITEMRPQSEYEKFRLIEETPEYEEKTLRPYQEELVEQAVRGDNTIVCAPTGSGKTCVAMYIIKRHLNDSRERGKRARAVILVPNVVLVEQHLANLNKYMQGEWYCSGMSGGQQPVGDANMSDRFLASDVIVMTSMILVNMLLSVRADQRVYLCDLSMVVLDECHHCLEKHPYNQLMWMLHDYDGVKPQIVGLTASLGVGRGINLESVKQHIFRLCANLHATSITTVHRERASLDEHVSKPTEELKIAQLVKGGKDSATGIIASLMQKIETELGREMLEMRRARNEWGLEPLSHKQTTFVDPHMVSKYSAFLTSLNQAVSRATDGERKYLFRRKLAYLTMYCEAMSMDQLLPSTLTIEYLKNEMEDRKVELRVPDYDMTFKNYTVDLEKCVKAELRSDMNQRLRAVEKEETGEAEWKNIAKMGRQERDEYERRERKLVEGLGGKQTVAYLKRVLRQQFRADSQSRAIIFVTMQRTTRAVASFLNQDDFLRDLDLPNADMDNLFAYVMSSQKGASGSGGMREEERRDALERFKRGECRCLVATDVIGEGLDVAECNLVIKYNYSDDVIGKKQKAGRARKKDSRVVLIALNDNVLTKEMNNIHGEKVMNYCVNDIRGYAPALFKKHMDEEFRKMDRERKALQKLQDEMRIKMTGKGETVEVLCRECNVYLCMGEHMKRVDSHYVCCDKGIWNRVHFDVKCASNRTKYVDSTTMVLANTACVKCAAPFGTVIQYRGCFLPTFIVSKITFVDKNGEHQLKKWHDVNDQVCYIEPAHEADMFKILNALSVLSVSRNSQLEKATQHLIQSAIDDANRKKAAYKHGSLTAAVRRGGRTGGQRTCKPVIVGDSSWRMKAGDDSSDDSDSD